MKNNRSKKGNTRIIPGYSLIPEGDHFKIRKISVTGDRVKNDPAFHLTRRINLEFTHVQQAIKLIRDAFITGSHITMPKGMLLKLLMQSLKEDEKNIYGRRNVAEGSLMLLKDLDFNIRCPLDKVFRGKITVVRGEQVVKVAIDPFPGIHHASAPETVTHCRIHITVGSFCFQEMKSVLKHFKTKYLPIKRPDTGKKEATFKLENMDQAIHMVAVRIEWIRSFAGIALIEDKKWQQPCKIVALWRQEV
jgi:hypothetical protein